MANKDKARHLENLWKQAAQTYCLTSRQVTMAKKLQLNPKNFSKYAGGNKQQSWKKPLGVFIEKLFVKKYPNSPEGQEAKQERQARKRQRKQIRREKKIQK